VKKIIATAQAPQAVGPYSQAVRAGNLLFVSGQIPLDPVTGLLVGGGIEAQTRQVLKNIGAILASEGLAFADVVKTTVFLQDMNDFSIVNKVYAEVFGIEPPARSCIEAAGLPKDARVEIEAIAVYK
jgi:2-iminobutanoate/2-iminopropanoate deaminase